MYTTLDGRTVTLDSLAGHVILAVPGGSIGEDASADAAGGHTADEYREAMEALTDEFAERGFFAVFAERGGEGAVGKPTLFSPAGERLGTSDDPEEDTFVALLEEHLPV